MTSGVIPAFCHRGMTTSDAPTSNSTLFIPLIVAFLRASSIASGTISTPNTRSACLARNKEIVPMPQ